MIFTITTCCLIILGTVVVLLALALALLGLFVWFNDIVQKYRDMGRQEQFYIDQQRIRDYSWWFSEDKPTMNVIYALAEDGIDIQNIRKKWRLEREPNKNPKEQMEKP